MNNLSEMEAALVQSLAASQEQQQRQLNELEKRSADLMESLRKERATTQQLRSQLQQSESALALVTRERDQLEAALSSASDALAGDTLVALPCAEGANKWFRPSAFKWFALSSPYTQKETGLKVRDLVLDGEVVTTQPVETMARIEAALHLALNPMKKQSQQPSTKPGQ